MERVAERLSGWGRYPRVETRRIDAADAAEVARAVLAEPSLIARGNGRSYGDAALNPAATLSLLPSRRILAFDAARGTVTCEAGLLLGELIAAVLPRGWFPPVSPGTRFVTIGGMIAADVHGKNHHGAGSFGAHVERLSLVLADGSRVDCSRTERPGLFLATLGGMGLTGVITEASFRLLPVETGMIRQRTLRAGSLAEIMALFDAARDATYSVAWIDALAGGGRLGRSVLFLGEHVRRAELAGDALLRPPRAPRLAVPFDFPGWALNRASISLFNALYHARNRPGEALVGYEGYFYPLDAILGWNRVYGAAGFMQFQCVLPRAASAAGMTALLRRAAAAGSASPLAVLKLFGPGERIRGDGVGGGGIGGGGGLLSFPMEGFTLAFDVRATQASFRLLAECDAIVADHGGRVYLAKDACATPALLPRFYPRLDEFRALRARIDPLGRFASVQSRRLGL